MSDKVQETVEEDLREETVDTSDPVSVNRSRKKASRTRADRLEFVKAAMGVEQGRAWFYDLLVRCRTINTPFSTDPYDTAFKCGMQNIGLSVMLDIQDAAPDKYITMVTEARGK